MNGRKLGILLATASVGLVMLACSIGADTTPNTTTASNSSGSGSGGSGSGLDGKSLVETRCIGCHPLSRAERRTRASNWPIIVNTMVGQGARLSNDEKTAVINYLTTNYSN